MTATSFKELMGQLKEDTTVQVAAADKKQLTDHYNFTEGWYDALLNTDKAIRSNTSICLTLPRLDSRQVKTFVSLLEKQGVAYDIGAYRDAPAGLRIWGGATVEEQDLESLMPWLRWAHDCVLESD